MRGLGSSGQVACWGPMLLCLGTWGRRWVHPDTSSGVWEGLVFEAD